MIKLSCCLSFSNNKFRVLKESIINFKNFYLQFIISLYTDFPTIATLKSFFLQFIISLYADFPTFTTLKNFFFQFTSSLFNDSSKLILDCLIKVFGVSLTALKNFLLHLIIFLYISLSMIILFIMIILYFSQNHLYSVSLSHFLNIGISALVFLNWTICVYSRKLDEIWVYAEAMCIPALLVTLFFVSDSIYYFLTSLNDNFSAVLVLVNVTCFIILLRKYSTVYDHAVSHGFLWSPVFSYLICLFTAIFFSYIILQINPFKIDVTKIGDPIGIIVGGEATIIALVFSISLVVMQQAASSYPPYLTGLYREFKTNPSFKFTVFIYLTLMSLGVCLLIPITEYQTTWGNTVHKCLIPVFFPLSLFALFSTYLFVSDTFKFLVPKNMIKILKASEKSGIYSIEGKNCIHVLGILLNSFKKYDHSTVMEGLYYLEDCKKKLFELRKDIVVPREYEIYLKLEKSLRLLASYFFELGVLSLEVGYKDCTVKIIKDLYDLRTVADRHEMESIVSITTESIEELAKKVVDSLISELNGDNSEIYECAVFALGEVRDRRAVSPIKIVFKNGNEVVKYTAISALGKIKSEEAITFLLKEVKNGNFHIINKIFSTFCENELLSIELLTKTSNDHSKYLRGFAALGLGVICDDIWAISHLFREDAPYDDDPYILGKAAHAIGKINDRYALNQDAIYILVKLMHDPSPYVKYNAVHSLGKIRIKDPQIISEIEGLLNYQDDLYVRDSAVYALKEINNPSFVESLNNALKTENKDYIRFNIILALGSIKGFHKIGPVLQAYFPQMSLPLYNLACIKLRYKQQSPTLPLYVAAFCTKSKFNGNNLLTKEFYDL